MKIVNKFLEKVGTDKVLHFLVCALFVAYASMLGVDYMWCTLVLTPFISVFKEALDRRRDKRSNLLAASACSDGVN